MKTAKEIVREKIIEILRERPEGIRFSELYRTLLRELPDIHPKTINGYMWKIRLVAEKNEDPEISIPEKGFWLYKNKNQ